MSDKRGRGRYRRILGLETEYGCLVEDAGPQVIRQVRDWVFERHRYGLLDRHQRAWDEPPGNGGFLFNGGRLYLDMGHLEYCTPECASVGDVVRYDRAGDRMLRAAVAAAGLAGRVSFIRNNIDHHSAATFGCHENYSLLRSAPLSPRNVRSLLAFLTLRTVFAGSGRVGEERPFSESDAPPVAFQLSQRADFIENDVYEWVQHNRAIINTRDEPLADPVQYRRLHLLHGDTSVLPSALYLRMGATRLVLDLLESDDLPPVALADAVGSLRRLSRCLRPPWLVELSRGGEADALVLLERYRTRAAKRFAGRDAETDAILGLWQRVDAALAEDPMQLVGLLDWVTKLHLLDEFRRRERLPWNDRWLEALDLEYHHIDPARSLGLAMADLSGPWAAGLDGDEALEDPPQGTRAAARGALMRRIAESGEPYTIDWHHVERGNHGSTRLIDPFAAHPAPAGE